MLHAKAAPAPEQLLLLSANSQVELLDDQAAAVLREVCLSFYDVRATAVEVVARLDLLSRCAAHCTAPADGPISVRLLVVACALQEVLGSTAEERWTIPVCQPLNPTSSRAPSLFCAAAPAACPATKPRWRPWRRCRCMHPWAMPWASRPLLPNWRTAASRWVGWGLLLL